MARKSKYNTPLDTDLIDSKFWNSALYVRISREDGDKEESDSISNQKDFLSFFIQNNPEIGLHDIYSDDGYSGSSFKRPEFERMQLDIEAGKVNCVIVKDLSRFGREKSIVAHYLEQYFPMHDVRFIAVNDQVDSYLNPDSVHDIVVAIKNVMNDQYCLDTSKKVKSSLDMKRRHGLFIGNYAPYGYQKSAEDRHKLVVDENVASVVKDIFRWFLSGYSLNGITKRLNSMNILSPAAYKVEQGLKSFSKHSNGMPCSNLWRITTIRRILKDEVYIGNLVQGQYKNKSYKIRKLTTVEKSKWITVKDTHEAIINKEEFDKVQQLLSMDTRTAPKKTQVYPLSGLVHCEDCGYTMCRKSSGKYVYYVCSVHKLKPLQCASPHSIREDKLKRIILKTLQMHIRLIMDMDSALNQIRNAPDSEKNFKRIEKAIKKNKDEIQRWTERKLALYDDYKDGLLSSREEYELQVIRHQKKIEDFQNRLLELENEYLNLKKSTNTTNSFIDKFKKFCNITELDRNVAITLINDIRIGENGNVSIEFNFKDEFEHTREFIEENTHLLKGPAA